MRFRILGPLRVRGTIDWVPVDAAQQRLLLATLLVGAGNTVSTQRLAHIIWGDQLPRTAQKTVHAYVMRLRRLLGDDSASILVTNGNGYELMLAGGDLDAWEFERLVEAGQRELAGGQPERATERLSEALALWRGSVLADVPASPSWAARLVELEQLRLAATEDRLTAMLELGRHQEAAIQLHRLVEEHPLRERLWALLMQAQRATGRRADALATYQRAHRTLRDELSLEPGAPLRQLQREILTEDQRPAAPPNPPPPALVVPAQQLPADVGAFSGRDSYLKHLDSLLPAIDPATATTVVISAIAGTAGVGKTALAVHWAHQVRDRFPDGQLYVNLRGYADTPPVAPLSVLGRFLRALGVSPEDVPTDVDEASALYRSCLAGKRVLVLLDNARSVDQVRPLLPGSGGCLALVTSRDRLGGLVAREGAVPLSLDVLTSSEADHLLTRLLGLERTGAEPAATAEIAQLCGHLPLALRIAAANLATHRSRSIASYATELATDRLAGLEVVGDRQAGVRAALDHSYASMPAEQQHLFRMVGLMPGPDFTAETAAVVAGVSVDQATRILGRLAAACLVNESADGRHTLHDLLRSYASARAGREDGEAARRAALAGLHGFYLRTIDAATKLLYPQVLRVPMPDPATGDPVEFDGHAAALAWLDAERANLVATVVHAAEYGPSDVAWRLADAMRGYLLMRMHVVSWDTVARAGLAAAQADRDLRGETAARISRAVLHWVRDAHTEAIDEYESALDLARRAGWREGESVVHGNLGNVYGTLGALQLAADCYRRGLDIDRKLGWLTGQATKLSNLAELAGQLGRLAEAVDHNEQAIALYRESGARGGEAEALTRIAWVYHALGRLDTAQACLTSALGLHRECGNVEFEAECYRGLAEISRDTGRLGEASRLIERAVALGRADSLRRRDAETLATTASIHHCLGEPDRAIAGYGKALESLGGRRDPYTKVFILIQLAAAECHAGRELAAAGNADAALAIARNDGFRAAEGLALARLGAARLRMGDAAAAHDHANQALLIHAEAGHQLGRAQAHLVAGHAHAATGDDSAADAHFRSAQDIFARIGADPSVPTTAPLPLAPDGRHRTATSTRRAAVAGQRPGVRPDPAQPGPAACPDHRRAHRRGEGAADPGPADAPRLAGGQADRTTGAAGDSAADRRRAAGGGSHL